MGFRGSRVQIPPSRLKRRAAWLAVFRRNAGHWRRRSLRSRPTAQIPPSRLVEEQASHRLRMRGFFFGCAPCCECCCESSRNSAAHNPLLRVQHLLPCGLGDRLLVRPEQRLLVIPSPASTMSRTSSHSFRSPTSSESRARSSIDLLMTRQGGCIATYFVTSLLPSASTDVSSFMSRGLT